MSRRFAAPAAKPRPRQHQLAWTDETADVARSSSSGAHTQHQVAAHACPTRSHCLTMTVGVSSGNRRFSSEKARD